MKLTVILASVREGRAGESDCALVRRRAKHCRQVRHRGRRPPRNTTCRFSTSRSTAAQEECVRDSTKQWGALVDGSDAFVFVTGIQLHDAARAGERARHPLSRMDL